MGAGIPDRVGGGWPFTEIGSDMFTRKVCTKRVFKNVAFIGVAVLWGLILLVVLAPIRPA